jgi:hypothetical protein
MNLLSNWENFNYAVSSPRICVFISTPSSGRVRARRVKRFIPDCLIHYNADLPTDWIRQTSPFSFDRLGIGLYFVRIFNIMCSYSSLTTGLEPTWH